MCRWWRFYALSVAMVPVLLLLIASVKDTTPPHPPALRSKESCLHLHGNHHREHNLNDFNSFPLRCGSAIRMLLTFWCFLFLCLRRNLASLKYPNLQCLIIINDPSNMNVSVTDATCCCCNYCNTGNPACCWSFRAQYPRRRLLRAIRKSRKTSFFKEEKLSYQPAGGCKHPFIPQIPVIQIKDQTPTSKLNPSFHLWNAALACLLSPPGSESLFILCQDCFFFFFFPGCCSLTHGWNEVSCSAWTDTCPT